MKIGRINEALLTVERLREVLQYDPLTGVFIWALQRRGRAQPGTLAGTNHGEGYRVIRVDNQDFYAHRLAWLYVHGKWPQEELDHIDGVRSHNAIANLREVNRQGNMHNSKAAKGYSLTTSGKWQAHIRVNRRFMYLGTFATKEAAHAAYLAAKRQLHPTFIESES